VAAERSLATALGLALVRAASPSTTAGAAVGGLPDEPSLNGYAVVEAGRVADVAAGALGALGDLTARPMRSTDAGLVRWVTARQEAFRHDSPGGAADDAEQLFLQGLPLASWDRLPEDLASVDGARLQNVARLAAGHEVVVIVGDAKVIAPALKKAGLEAKLVPAPR
jgi:predicted Zn-dependent peptidase